jgi:DNA repair protein RecN (Recombination protein N)
MLQRLSIKNYAIIDELEILFSAQLNIITGETGAGKSIIMGALGLILGERADSSVLVNKEKKSVVEGYFAIPGKAHVRQFLLDNDFDVNDELVIRREISVTGKSRAFINDTPVNLSQLSALSGMLVDLHQQFDTMELGESGFQRSVIDALAASPAMLAGYRERYHQWIAARQELKQLLDEKQRFDKEADYNQFQFNELDEAAFKENEVEEIDSELKVLANAEGIKAALDKAYHSLEESDAPIVQQLKTLSNQLAVYSAFHPGIEELLPRINAAQIELRDIADEVEHISAKINYDPSRITDLNERMSIGYRLMKKHGVNSTNELLAVMQKLEASMNAVLQIDEQITEKQALVDKLAAALKSEATLLSRGRKKQVGPLETNVNKLLSQVGMPNAKMKVQIAESELGPYGTDVIEFLFDANLPSSDKGKGQFQPVGKVASGGELSRLMLCIKSLVAQTMDLPTMIFDEIDSGISGEAARQVGIIMKDLANQRQVICITHQPQIAGKANSHFFVYKEIAGDMVKTNIRQLNTDERITAIARMLSGEKPTAAAMENAKEMIGN